MRIDPVLCRQILADIEADPNAGGGQFLDISIDGYDERTIAYHVKHLWETNMISGADVTSRDSPSVPEISVTDITPEGRTFLNGDEKEAAMEKNGIFISHITEEGATAAALKQYLRQVFSLDLPIFVSSDYESIPGGEVWFTKIIEGLKNASVVIVLLSPDSLCRRWVNFEAGIGVGADATVIPVVVHGLERNDVGHPLCSLQIRSLQSTEDAKALIHDIAKKLGLKPNESVHSDALVMHATQGPLGGGWVGVEWNGSFLAIDGPLDKLPKREDQIYIDDMGAALKAGGFATHLANKYDLGRVIALGYKVVQMTDRKTFRAELVRYDVVLVARPEESKP